MAAPFPVTPNRTPAEEFVRLGEERFRQIADAAPVMIWLAGTDKLCTYVNKRCLEFTGQSLEHDVGNGWLDNVHPDDVKRCVEEYELYFDRRQTFRMEYRMRRYDGQYRWIIDSGAPRYNEDGSFAGYIGSALDVTERKLAEESQARLAAIVESSEDAIISKTLDGIITSWNTGAQHLFGYTSEEVIGRPITSIIPPELRDEERKILAKVKSGEPAQHFETVRVTKAGKKVNVSLGISPIRDATGKIVGAAKIARDITQRKSAERELINVRRRLAYAQEEERARIGRELHDDINQRLAMLAIEIDQLQIHFPKSAAVRNRRLTDLKQRLIDASGGVQALSHQLHPAQLQYLGLVGSMRSFCRDFSERQGIKLDFTAEHIPDVPDDLSLSFFRVVQEAMHNAAKHGEAQQIKVSLSSSSTELQLTISDNGKGFDPNEAMAHEGLGLISMRERMRLIGGAIAIQSAAGGGTTIRVTAPLRTGEQSHVNP
jgi:PAS domain S-box-containing protein